MISKLCLIVDHALDLQNVFDSSQMSIQNTFIVIEKIMQYIDQLEGMRDSIVIKGSDLELKKISEETENSELQSEESKQVVANFMKLFQKEHGIE